MGDHHKGIIKVLRTLFICQLSELIHKSLWIYFIFLNAKILMKK